MAWAYCLATLATLAFALAALLWINYHSVIAEAEREAEKDTRAFASLTALNFGRADRLLQHLLEAMELEALERPGAEDMVRRDLRQAVSTLSPQSRIAIVLPDPAGGSPRIIVGRNLPETEIPLLAADAHLAGHARPGAAAFQIGLPTHDSARRRFYIPVSRRLAGPDGAPRAVAIALIDPTAFADIYKSFHYGAFGSVSLYRDDGILLAREPFSPQSIGQNFAHGPVFAEHLKRAPAGVYRAVTQVDGVEHIITYRRIEGLPMVAGVGRGVVDVLGPWRAAVLEFIAAYVVVAGLLVAIVIVFLRYRQRADTAEQAERATARRLQSLIASVPGTVFQIRIDAEGGIDFLFASDQAAAILGVAATTLMARPGALLGALHPDDAARLTAAARRAAADASMIDIELRLVAPTGPAGWVRLVAVPETADGPAAVNAPAGVWDGVAVDITENRLQRAAIDEREAHLRSILESGYDAIVSVRRDGRILEWNAQAERIFECPAQEAFGQRFLDLALPPDERAAHAQRVAPFMTAAAGAKPAALRAEAEFMRRSGQRFPAEFTAVSSRRLGEDVTTYLMTDISERHALEEQNRQAQRMSAVGMLTGGIAHEFNNLLTVVLGNAELLKEGLGRGGDAVALAERIERAAVRGADLTHRLLAFSRKQPLKPAVLAIDELLADIAPLARPLAGETVRLEVTAPPRAGLLVSMDAGQLQSAVFNLVINARDAMPNGGTIRIAADARQIGQAEGKQLGVAAGEYVSITVSDTGTGMTPEVIRHAFEPFFTTKDVGKGTGLGLSMVHGFMSQSGGAVRIESRVGAGTVVTLLMPRAEQPAPRAASGVPLLPVPQPKLTVLMVEDDRDVLAAGAALLRNAGYRVVEAGDGPAALDALSRLDAIDVLFTDVILPGGMNGLDVAKAVKRRFPAVPVVFTSGYNENVIVHHGVLDDGVNLLRKPYSVAQITEAFGRARAEAAQPHKRAEA